MSEMKTNRAFAKGVSTAFIIESPFQLLCAWEAIEEFEIKDYKIVLVIDANNIRNKQTIAMLKDKKMAYDEYYWNDESFKDIRPQNVRYDRIMIGDYDDLCLMQVCEYYASKHAEVVFMDDGLSSIMLLKGLPYQHTPFLAKIRKLLKGDIAIERARKKMFEHWEEIGIENNYTMYTLYDNIKSRKFKIYPNSLSHLCTKEKKGRDVILIVGTTILDVAYEHNIPVPVFEGLMWTKLVEVKEQYPDKEIIYIPHGRDRDPRIEDMCKCLHVEFKRLDMSIEYYVVKENLHIEAIYGMLSTALSTLRKMTGAPITLWSLDDKKDKYQYLHRQYMEYYERMGMKVEEIHVQR